MELKLVLCCAFTCICFVNGSKPVVCVTDEQSCTLRDAEAEVLFGFSLEESLKRAQSAPLFKVL